MKLTAMKQLLAKHDLQLTKSLGQNFLHDANQLRRIVAAAELTRADKVLEIGPGLGPLTDLLVEAAGEVLAIEKDARFIGLLEQWFTTGLHGRPQQTASTTQPRAAFHLVHADALHYLRHAAHDWREWKLVSNLPYSVASPILVELAQAERGPERLVATLQAEVAQRLLAEPGDPDYGLLTLLIQMKYQPLSSFRIPASCFFPTPEVDSACVTLLRRECPPVPPELRRNFIKLVKRSFSQRRKMMLKLLKLDWSAKELQRAFQAVGLPPDIRAERVGLKQFAELARQLPSETGC
jgi:16S rRNA (adenine1518-N6/adenine1519-N6)-dimethyltransferase